VSGSSFTRRSLITAAFAHAACARRAGSGYRGFAYVATEESRAIAVVDMLAFAVRSRIELKGSPTGIVTQPGAKANIAYIIEHDDAGLAWLQEVNLAQRLLRRRIARGKAPLLVKRQAGGMLWLAARDERALIPLDPEGFRPGRPVNVPAPVVSLDVSSRAGLACAALADGTLQFVDLNSRKPQANVKLHEGAQPGEVCFRSDGRTVMVCDRANRLLAIADVEKRQLMTELPLSLRPDNLCMKEDGGQLFITGGGQDAVVIAYPYRTEIAQTSLSGRKPGAMACSSEPEFLFVANPSAGSVTVLDLQTQKVLAVTGVGLEPSFIAVTPDQQYALVLNRASGDMGVIRIAAITARRTRQAPLFTMIPVGAKPVSAVVLSA
jgi:YVTN family beta-propeller protein